MKDNNTFALKMNKAGELLLENSDDAVKAKYKPDSLLLCAPVSYLLMLFCVVIDIAFFRSLFVRISYDSPIMIWGQVAGLAFAADVVAAFAGILAKKIRQGLSHDKFNLALLLAVPIFALIINGVLRFSTMSLSSADGTVDAATIALTIIAIATPVFTSVGNFAISFELYNPLAKQLCREEIALNELQDSIRRLEAIQDECNSFNSLQIQDADHQHLINAKKDLINDSLTLLADMRVQLMEQLGDPTSTNVLSKSRSDAIFDRLNRELAALAAASGAKTALPAIDRDVTTKNHVVNFSEAV